MVNGQTGKVFADTPIDPRRYVISSLLLALPIYLLLNVFLTLRPQTLLNLSSLFLVLGAILFRRNLRDIEDRMADKRMRIRREKAKPRKTLFARISEVLILVPIILMLGIYPLAFAAVFLDVLSPLIVLGYMCVWIISYGKQRSALSTRTLAVSFCAALGILILTVARPVSDLYYYGGVLLCMGAVLFMIFELIRSYNMLASQPLPQFRRTGGDDRA
ncbi:MAG: hypothetical protein Q4B26_09235 [Eubacteriales bacterium]|nr:hypothetical protein [Eubacteriales bacterium]